MRRAALFAMLLIVSGSAWAEWVKVEPASTADTRIYFDPKTVHEADGFTRVWVMEDYTNKTPDWGALSATFLMELDCKQWRLRVLLSRIYHENMEQGGIFATLGSRHWTYVQSHTAGGAILTLVCAK